MLEQARRDLDPAARNRDLDRAETILLETAPVIPLYFYTNPYLISPSVQNWNDNLFDFHRYQQVWLKP